MIEKLTRDFDNEALLDDIVDKINEIIDHINQQEEKNNPCEHKYDYFCEGVVKCKICCELKAH